MSNNKSTKAARGLFTTRMGVLAATVGSAVGLGNIWRFPYEVGANGGGAFMICNLVFSLLIGLPVLCAEFILGRGTRSSITRAYRRLSPEKSKKRWACAGYLAVTCAVLILGFYSVVAGWTVEYFFQSLTGGLNLSSQEHYHRFFDEFSSATWKPLMWVGIFVIANFIILIKGAKGIERMSNLLMPALFIILIVFGVNSLTLDRAGEGLYFLFHPDWSSLNGSMMLAALGQSFFSLSLGMGCMTTYASYFNDTTNLSRSAVITTVLDLLVAIMAGVIIFPAVFSFGGTVAAGPKLVFEVLPGIFSHMAMGTFWSALFFFLLILASLTSTISMHEIVITFLTEERHMSRRNATLLDCAVTLALAVICSLSFGLLSDVKLAGLTAFNLLDYLSSNILMPVGGLMVALFVGYVVDRKLIREQLTNRGSLSCGILGPIVFSLRYLAPIAITLIFLNSIGIL